MPDFDSYFALLLELQYAILLTIVVTIQMKYILHIIDLRSENPWDNKAVYLLYTELITGKKKKINKTVIVTFNKIRAIYGSAVIMKHHRQVTPQET